MKTLNIKSIIIILLMGMLTYSADAQKKIKQVPQAVSAAFTNQYPNVNLRNWYVNAGQYIACFRYNNRDWMAHYSADGNWLRSERNIKHMASLPYDVRMTLKSSKYASYHIDEMARLQMPDHSLIYRLRVDNNSGNKVAYEDAGSVDNESLYFNDHGRLVRTANGGDE